MKKKCLIICYNFLPYFPSFGGVSRACYLLKYLRENSVDCHLLSVSGKFHGYFGNDWVQNDDHVYYVKSRINMSKQQLKPSSDRSSLTNTLIRKLAQFINDTCLIPDFGVVDLFKLYHNSCELIDEHGIDNIIITAPPHSVNLLIPLLKRKYPKLNCVLEYRDSWNTQPIFRKSSNTANKLSKILERLVLNSASKIVTVSPVVVDLINDDLGVDVSNKTTLIMNGYYAPLSDGLENINVEGGGFDNGELNEPLKVGYFGVISDRASSFRKPDVVIELAKLYNNIHFDFYGQFDIVDSSVEDIENIKYCGQLTHKEAYKKMKDYDFLMLLHTDKSSGLEPIPGKFFDYVYSRKPIICISNPNSQAAKLIKNKNLGLVFDPELKYVFNDFYNQLIEFKKTFEIDLEFIGSCSRNYQFKKYHDLLI